MKKISKSIFLNVNKGFTLIELLVVIGIIGLLSTLVTAGVNLAREKAKIAKAQHEVDQIYEAISMLTTDAGVWPGHQPYNTVCSDLPGSCPANNEFCGPDDSLVPNDCVKKLNGGKAGILLNDVDLPFSNWSGPYMPSVPLDPWGNEYFFDTDYTVDENGKPWACGSGTVQIDVVAVGSYGPNGIGKLDEVGVPSGDCDDILKILK
jgi:prepilin-type N-terminal cleavage/methylation domain-containing protein